jgi:cobalt/nickel transport system permease protein
MHISDGLLPPAVCAAGFAAAGALTWVGLRRTGDRDIPRLALMTSAFFAASLLSVPVGLARVHLLLNGLVGVVAGPAAMIPIVIGVSLQALLFQHGGLTTIGVNAVVMGLPALLAGGLARRWAARSVGAGAASPPKAGLVGFLAGAGAILVSLMLFLLVGLTADPAFFTAISAFLLAHAPLAGVEGLVTGAAIAFLARVKPEVFDESEPSVRRPAAGAV